MTNYKEILRYTAWESTTPASQKAVLAHAAQS